MALAKSLYLIVGDDEYSVSTNAREIVQNLVPPEEEAFGLEIIEGKADTVDQAKTAAAQTTEALQTVGLLAGAKTVWLRDANFLGGAQVSKSTDVKDKVKLLAEVIKAGLAPDQRLVISADKVDKRSVLYKAFKDADADIRAFEKPDKAYLQDRSARDFSSAELKRAGLTLERAAFVTFLERVGSDNRQIANEVEKLSLYAGERTRITEEDVRAIISSAREAIVWDLADAVSERDLPRALSTLRQLLFQKEMPIGLVIGLERRMGELLLIREALDRGWLEVSGGQYKKSLNWNLPEEMDGAFTALEKEDPRKMHPFRAGKLVDQAEKYSMRELKRGQILAINTHEQIVSTSAPKSVLLELLIMKIIRRPSRPARSGGR